MSKQKAKWIFDAKITDEALARLDASDADRLELREFGGAWLITGADLSGEAVNEHAFQDMQEYLPCMDQLAMIDFVWGEPTLIDYVPNEW